MATTNGSYLEHAREQITRILSLVDLPLAPSEPGSHIAIELLAENCRKSNNATKRRIAALAGEALLRIENCIDELRIAEISGQASAEDVHRVLNEGIQIGALVEAMVATLRKYGDTLTGANTTNGSKRLPITIADRIISEIAPGLRGRLSKNAVADRVRKEFQRRHPKLKVPHVDTIRHRIP